jgi:hypothetical protein
VVAEATVPILATLKAAAEIPATWSGMAECSAMFPGNKSCEGKKRVPAVAGKPSFLSHLSLFSP